MTDREVKLVLAGLLHDVGKVIYRPADYEGTQGQSGYEFLRDEAQIEDRDILDGVRYYRTAAPQSEEIEKDSLAYIVASANHMVSAAERRKSGTATAGFNMSMPMQSIFNRLNRNRQEMYYSPDMLKVDGGINYPTAEIKEFDETYYAKARKSLTDHLRGMKGMQEDIRSLLDVLEENFSYFPSSADGGEAADISLYDHLKLTAAVASCILGYLEAKGITDYREELSVREEEFDAENAFLLCSMDVSGIQGFIYTITSENALRTLRARSFYLEIMMEHIIDCILQELGLSRANLIYSGGGHCYILMPNTHKVRDAVDGYMDQLNHWLMETFDIALYVAWGYAFCSANSLKNVPEGSYAQIFRQIGDETGRRKSHRYSAADILAFNFRQYDDYTRECKMCRKISQVDEDGICPVCRAIQKFSRNILYDEFYAVTDRKEGDALPLPGGYYLVACCGRHEEGIVRIYSKNRIGDGTTKLWVGDYTAGKTFEEYAGEAEGIERIGILRADVDNLGQAFVAGFENPENGSRYVTLSRTAALSRQLSLFFKLHINRILSQGGYSISGKDRHPRNVTICYSGGDDIFIAGSWNEVVELAIDLKNAFKRYTQNALTFSAGIGIYVAGYPISAIAGEVAGLEDASKKLPGKGAVTIFPDGQSHLVRDDCPAGVSVGDGTYGWQEFEESVIGEKYRAIDQFFRLSEERGKNFLYNLLELIRNRKDRINFARYVYLLSRLEPERDAAPEQREAYRQFSSRMYQWIKCEVDCRQLKTAMNLYAYLRREKEEMENAD